MKIKTILAVSFFGLISTPLTQADTSVPDFGSHWLKSPWITTQTDNGDYKARAFMRVVQVRDHSYPVGSLTYFKFPKKGSTTPFAYQEVLNTLQVGMGIPHWIQRTVGRAQVYEGQWVPLNRFIQVYVRENADSVEYSVAMMRLTYMLPTAVESEIIQRQLFNEMPPATGKNWLKGITASVEKIEGLLISEASAGGGCDCGGASLLSDPACVPTCLGGSSTTSSIPGTTAATSGSTSGISIPGVSGSGSTSGAVITTQNNVVVSGNVTGNVNQAQLNQVTGTINGTNTQLAGLNGNLANTNTQISTFNTNMAGTNAQLGKLNSTVGTQGAAANANWANTNTNISALNSTANTQLGKFNAALASYEPTLSSASNSLAGYNQDWKDTNAQFGRMVDLMKQEMQPGRLFITAGATAAGAVIGSQLATMAIEGLTLGVKAFAEKIGLIKKESDVLKVQHFKDLREAYEHSKDSALVLESKIDATLAAMDSASNYNFSNEQILKQMGPTVEEYTARLKVAQSKLESDIVSNAACIADDSKMVSDLRAQLEEYKAIKEKLAPGSPTACKLMADNFQKIDEAEGELQTMRLKLYDTKDAVLAAQASQNKDDHKIIQRITDDKASAKSTEASLKTAEKERERSAKEVAASQDKLISRCDDVVEGFVKLNPDAMKKKGWFNSNIKNACKNFVQRPEEKNQDFLASFGSGYQDKLKETLDGANFFSDVGKLDMQAFQNAEADKRAVHDINRGLANDQRMNPTTNLSGAATEGELAALTRYFEQLKLDQSGSETDSVFLKLMRDKDRFQSVCGDDAIRTQLDARDKTYTSSRQ